MNLLPLQLLHARICPSCQDAVAIKGETWRACNLVEYVCLTDRRHVTYDVIVPQEQAA